MKAMKLLTVFIMMAALMAFLAINEAFPQVAPSSFRANAKININSHIIVDQTVTNTTFTAATEIIGKTIGFSIQVNITGCVACSGTVRLNGSIDGVVFTLIPGCEANYTGDGSVLFNVPAIYFPYLQFEAEETTGSATTFNVFKSVKEDISG